MDVSPPVTFFEGDTFINTTYKESVQLKKCTAGVVKYKVTMESRNRQTFDCTVNIDGQLLSNETEEIEGLLKEDYVDIEI